jgi:hypothetical protein
MMTDEHGKLADSTARHERRRGSAALILHSVREAHAKLVESLELLLADEVASPRELIDQLGVETLDKYLPLHLRVRVLDAALAAGRTGVPFDDDALLKIVPLDALVRALPVERIRETLEALCAREDLTPAVVAPVHVGHSPRRRTMPPPLPASEAKGARPPPLPGGRGLHQPPPLPMMPAPPPLPTAEVPSGDELEALDETDVASEPSSAHRSPASRRGRVSLVPSDPVLTEAELVDEQPTPTRRSTRPASRAERPSTPPQNNERKGPSSRRR